MRKLCENFQIFYFQKRTVSAETIRGNTVLSFLKFLSALFIISVGLTMTLISDKMLISYKCIRGLTPNLVKSWIKTTKNCQFLDNHFPSTYQSNDKELIIYIITIQNVQQSFVGVLKSSEYRSSHRIWFETATMPIPTGLFCARFFMMCTTHKV